MLSEMHMCQMVRWHKSHARPSMSPIAVRRARAKASIIWASPAAGAGVDPERADRPLELFAAGYRHRLDRPGASQISDLDLGREAGDTIRDFPLETHDNGQSQNHHRHAQRYRDHGDTNHHTRTVAGSVTRDSARYEQFEIHPLPILHVFFMQSNINFSYFCSINRPL